jgi:hypothetical protein
MNPQRVAFVVLVLCIAGSSVGPARGTANTPEGLAAELQALRPAKLVWRDVEWNRCLLDGLQRARAAKKPVLLWAFINADPKEERC